jgi:DNA mismatch repair ATPase MutS
MGDGMQVRYLVKRVGCPCLFVTHYPQLADLTHDNTLK